MQLHYPLPLKVIILYNKLLCNVVCASYEGHIHRCNVAVLLLKYINFSKANCLPSYKSGILTVMAMCYVDSID